MRRLAVDDTRFDSSQDPDAPLGFSLVCTFVIPGPDADIKGMQVDWFPHRVIPPQPDYGFRDAGGIIPPDATLILEIE